MWFSILFCETILRNDILFKFQCQEGFYEWPFFEIGVRYDKNVLNFTSIVIFFISFLIFSWQHVPDGGLEIGIRIWQIMNILWLCLGSRCFKLVKSTNDFHEKRLQTIRGQKMLENALLQMYNILIAIIK